MDAARTHGLLNEVRVWVDLVNSPQVLVLGPIVRELRRRGHEVHISSRAFAQTVELADQAGLEHTPLGRHGGAMRARAVAYNLERVGLLVRFARPRQPDLALSHNSYSQALAARALRIPFVTMMDYEHHRANHVAFRLARRVLVPSVFPPAALARFGALDKTVRYPGFKENLYLADFHPDPTFRSSIGVPEHAICVVLRPPATWADYYHGQGQLFSAVIDRLAASDDTFIVYLPRVRQQRAVTDRLPASRVLVPARALDGPNLVSTADLVISGGGTMIREAAVLGTPAYSVFEGDLGAVDATLACEGRLRWLRGADDVRSLALEPKAAAVPRAARPDLVEFVTDAILSAASS